MQSSKKTTHISYNGPLTRYVKLRVAHAPGMLGTFSPPLSVSDLDMHHGTCVTHVPWCMPGSLINRFPWRRWRGKRSRHSRRMRNTQFYVSGKRPMLNLHVRSRALYLLPMYVLLFFYWYTVISVLCYNPNNRGHISLTGNSKITKRLWHDSVITSAFAPSDVTIHASWLHRMVQIQK